MGRDVIAMGFVCLLIGGCEIPTTKGEVDSGPGADAYDRDYPSGIIVMWSGPLDDIPSGWKLCDGSDGTPDLRDRFILGTADGEEPGYEGGSHEITLSIDQLPAHDHGGLTGGQSASHVHTGTSDSNYAWDSCGIYSYGGDVEFEPHTFYGHYVGANCTYRDRTAHAHTFTTGAASADHTHGVYSQGSGVSVDIRPAYYALAFIMRR